MRTATLLTAWCVLLLFVCTGKPAPSAAAANGITEPFLDVKLSLAVPGIVTSKRFKEGDAVKAGDVILVLDKQLEELEVVRRKAVMENRKTDLDATATLFKSSKSVSKDELDKRQLEFKVASTEHDIAVEQLARRQLICPLSGLITEMDIEVGESCQPYQSVARVVDISRAYLVTHLEAKEAAGLKLGEAVKLEVETGASPVGLQGKISFLSPVADPASGLIRVKVIFDNSEGKLRPGLPGRILLN